MGVIAKVSVGESNTFIDMELKEIQDIENCPKGVIVIIDEYTGIFWGIEDNKVKLKSMYSNMVIGLELDDFFIDEYWQELKTI